MTTRQIDSQQCYIFSALISTTIGVYLLRRTGLYMSLWLQRPRIPTKVVMIKPVIPIEPLYPFLLLCFSSHRLLPFSNHP